MLRGGNVWAHHVDMNINRIYRTTTVVNDDLVMHVVVRWFYLMILWMLYENCLIDVQLLS